MNLTAILLLASCLQISALGNSQGITLNVRNAPLTKVFHEIKKQTGYTFMYTETMLKESKRVSIDIENSTLQEALILCFASQPFTYRIINKTVVVQPKEVSAANISIITPLPLPPPPIEIHGRVVNQQGAPLPNVSVLIMGTNVGTATNSDGRFTITAPDDKNIVLEVSSVGYQTQRVDVGKQGEVNVTLELDISGLSDVVVVGYGTAKKADLTGSIAHIDAEQFRDQSNTQISNMLNGSSAGVYTIQDASAAGGGKFEIRGPSSLSAGTNPLIVVNGAIFNGDMADIDPNTVKSIDVLKDASSKAVYGSSSSSGVILITTKQGKIGKPVISFSAKDGLASTTHDLRPFGPQGYFTFRRDFLTQFNGSSVPYGFYFNPNDLPAGITLQQWRDFSSGTVLPDNIDEWLTRLGLQDIEVDNYKAGKTTDWYDMTINSGLRQDYSLSLSGASENIKYFISAGYLNNKGILKGDKFKTLRSTLGLNLKITKWLDFNLYSQFSSRDQSVIEADLDWIRYQSPYGEMWNPDGSVKTFTNNDYARNPLDDYYNGKRLNRFTSLFSILDFTVKLPLGFQYKISFQPDFNFSKDFISWGPASFQGGNTHIGGYGTRSNVTKYDWRLDNLITWKREFGPNNIDLTLLASMEENRGWSSYQENSRFAPSATLGFSALQFGSEPALLNTDQKSTGDALMARLNYSLLNKYLLSASIRRDGFSGFGQKNPWGVFPAIGIAWKISNEPFYKIPFIDQMKVRASWGVNGNKQIGNYSAFATVGSRLGYDGSRVLNGIFNTTLGNPGLKWEKNKSINIGLDLGFFQNRINFTIDAYSGTTYDLLMNRLLPVLTGFNSVTTNLGKMSNKGIEFTVDANVMETKNFRWQSSLNLSFNKNKILVLSGDTGTYKILGKVEKGQLPDYTNFWFPGQSLDVVWDYDVIGVWQEKDKDAAAVYSMVPGDLRATDVNDDGRFRQFDDKRFIGFRKPRVIIGLRNNFTFFNSFNLNISLQIQPDFIRSIPILADQDQKSIFHRVNFWSFPYWTPQNPINSYQRYTFPDNLDQYEGEIQIYKPSGFLRVQNISLSYNFPKAFLQRSNLQDLRVFAAAQNFFTFTRWPGFDPESGMVPMHKILTFGANLSF